MAFGGTWLEIVVFIALSVMTLAESPEDKSDAELIKGLQRSFDRKLEELTREVTSLKRENADLARKVASLEEGSGKDRKRVLMTEAPVAFYSQLTVDLQNLGVHQTIVFDNPVTNYGAGYNHHDGVFTAPTAGIYVFTWTTQNRDRSHMRAELVIKNVVKGMTWSDAYSHDDNASATNTAVVHLDVGDTVWIRANYPGPSHVNLQGDMSSTFSGWLLYEL